MTRTLGITMALAGALVGLGLAGSAQAGSETCRDWLREHADWATAQLRARAPA